MFTSKFKFKQGVSMNVNPGTVQEDLIKPLITLGYHIDSLSQLRRCPLLVNTAESTLGRVNNVVDDGKYDSNYLITDYNPELFLAIAAMTDEEMPIVGEWLVVCEPHASLPVGTLFRVNSHSNRSSCTEGTITFNWSDICRRATLEELVNRFSMNEEKENTEFSIDPDNWWVRRPSPKEEVYEYLNKRFNVEYLGEANNYGVVNGRPIAFDYPETSGTLPEITIWQFRKYILNGKPKKKIFPITISSEEATEIYSVCTPTLQRSLIVDEGWGHSLASGEVINIHSDSYKMLRDDDKNGTSIHEVLDKILGPDEPVWSLKDAENGQAVLVSDDNIDWYIRVATGDGACHGSSEFPDGPTHWNYAKPFTLENIELINK